MTKILGFIHIMLQDKTIESDRRSMKTLASCILLVGLSSLIHFSGTAVADEILVVTGEDAPVNTLNRTETANLFLGLDHTTTSLTPFDQRDRDLRRDFYREVAGRSLASVRAHWAKRVFTGRGRPPDMLAAGEVDQAIRENPASVTYVPEVQLPNGGKVLLNLPRGTQQ